MKVLSLSRGCEIAQFLFATPKYSRTQVPSSSRGCEIGCEIYAPKPTSEQKLRNFCSLHSSQTKILEDRTKDEIRIFD